MNNKTLTGARFVAAAASVTLAGGLMLCAPALAHAAASVNTSVAAGKSYSKVVANGKTAGKAKANAAALSGMKVSLKGVKGSVSYKATGASDTVAAKNGKAAATSEVQTMSVSLSGAAKKKYDVYYRAYTPGYGWLGWAKNGAAAGTKVQGKAISAVQVKLNAKNKALSGYSATKSVACVSNAGFYNGLTGDAATDAKIASLAKKGKTLEGSFKAYLKMMEYGQGNGALKMGDYPTNRLMKEAKQAFKTHKGDCYTYTGGFTCVARYLGYEVAPVAGKLKNKYGEWSDNSWCLIKNGDREEIWNAQLQDQADPDGDGLMTQTEVVRGENGFALEKGDTVGTYNDIVAKCYGITKAEVNDYAATFDILPRTFTGFGYASSEAEMN